MVRVARRRTRKRLHGQQGRAPGPEHLRGDLGPARRVAEVLIDVLRPDRVCLASLVEVLEELLARQLLHASDDCRETPIADRDLVAFP